MADRFTDPLLTPTEVSKNLLIPRPTVYSWLNNRAAAEPLVHRVTPERRGWSSVPFIAVVEAYVLRSLRDLRLSTKQIREAAADVRREFNTPYALASKRIATDGIDIFVDHADGNLARVGDHQAPIRQVIDDHLRYITWGEAGDEYATQLQLRQYPDVAPVIIDPRFGWGAPVVQRNRVPVRAVVDLFAAGESIETVAEEYDMTRDEVEAICQSALHVA